MYCSIIEVDPMISKGPFVVKVVVCGDGAVGKTALRRRFMGEQFQASYLETLGADFVVKTISFDYILFKAHIWDLAGQPEYKNVRKMYYTGAMGALIVFDISRWDTFESIPNWVEEVWKSNGLGLVPVVFIGNKIDLRIHGIETIPQTKGAQYASSVSKFTNQFGFETPYLETSAKFGTGVDEAFYILMRNIFTYLRKKQEPKSEI